MADLDQHAISVKARDLIRSELSELECDELDVYRSGESVLTIRAMVDKSEIDRFLGGVMDRITSVLGDNLKYDHAHSGQGITKSTKKQSLLFIWVKV